MRYLSTHHTECLRQKPSAIDSDLDVKPRRPTVDLVQLLQCLDGETNLKNPERGKRKAETLPVPTRHKRLKMAGTQSREAEEEIEDGAELHMERTAIPAYHHTFEIQYSLSTATDEHNEYIDDDTAKQYGWFDQEAALLERLKQIDVDEANSGVYHIGELTTAKFDQYLGVYTKSGQSDDYLLLLPSIESDFDFDAYDIRLRSVGDPLLSFQALQGVDRIELSIRSDIIVHKPLLETSLSFTLRVELSVALICPTIYEPIYNTIKGRATEIEEAQRRMLLHLFPVNVPASFHHNIDIPLLYSVLEPAPRLRTPRIEEAAQPTDLLPTLLPFQRRSVAWMLGREGQSISDAGEIVAKTKAESDLPPLWIQAPREDGGSWYLNRVTGRVLSSRPENESENAFGGILAEEPGLGKTLECIALILLNPGPGRNPHNSRWDPQAKVHVKEIKTTLIVTPVSLAPQWIDELALHAPSLKILIYDGWSKITVPITEEDAEEEREKRRKAAVQGKRRRIIPKRSTTRVKTPGKVVTGKTRKRNDEDDEDDADSEQERNSEDAENNNEILDWCAYVNTFDVCITTYNVLQHDLDVARPPPVRSRRANVLYSDLKRSRSPLVMCEWYRVIMDEVQMVGGGKTEEMVSLIPRRSSFAVSGTPARAQVSDLIHVLKFLRVSEVTNSGRVWMRLCKPGYVHEFLELFHRISIRTIKTAVQDELTIPKQTRFLVPIELGRLERHIYAQNFEQALLNLGLDARGVAVTRDWEADTGLLRTWLRKLRGICTHPQVGQLQNQVDKLHKYGVLKTMGEVLEDMREQNWRNIMDDRRNEVQMMTVMAQLQQRDEHDNNRYHHSLETLLQAEVEAHRIITEVEAVLTEHNAKGEVLKRDATNIHETRVQIQNNEESHTSRDLHGKGKGTERIDGSTEDEIISDDEDSELGDLPRTPAGEEHAIKKRALQQRLRECNIVLHKIHFLKGDINHVLGNTADEEQAYAVAEELRRILLKGTENAAKRAMAQLTRDTSKKGITEEEMLIPIPYMEKGGIRSSHLMEEANEIIEEVLNEQSTLLWQWRMRIITLLTQSLTSGDEDADGQEYARSLDAQGEVEYYLQAYAALLADRREVLTAERTLLAAHDIKETKARKTRAAKKAVEARFAENEGLAISEEFELPPEHQVIQSDLQAARKALLEEFDSSRAVKSVMVDLSNIAARIVRDNDIEKILAKEGATRLRTLLGEQGKLMEKLQADLALLRKAFNDRILYFRQLQEISDTVAEPDWEGNIKTAIANSRRERQELEAKIKTTQARERYLSHLARSQGNGTMDEDESACVLCRCEFTRGYITACAHSFCETCLKAWVQRKEGKVCPICRVAIVPSQLQRFSIEQDIEKPPPPPIKIDFEAVPRSTRVISYNNINPTLFEQIQSVETHGSYGSKIQTLVRHLLYLQYTEPGAKSIIFSAWADSLHIIEHALTRNSISSIRIDQNRGKQNAAKIFRTDPEISVFLLHGERENAGLNVTCASRVFLVESVVHHAFEIQAIARIDRMGQTRPTEVYCYYAEDTVERNILDLAAKRGQSLYTEDHSAGTLNVTPFTMNSEKSTIDSPAKKNVQKGDFVFKTDDMLAIFFPHLFEDIEYLIPIEEDTSILGRNNRDSIGRQQDFVNAVAGPSRI